MKGSEVSWYKNAIIYAVDVRTFMDSNGDGIGDFPGLTSCLDYLADLGVNCLWVLPFYPTPYRDNGYDISDYFHVDERLGSLHDFIDFVHRAGERGIQVLPDFVMNHTSDEHPWFQASRFKEDSLYHDFYVWSDDPPPVPVGESTVFPGEVNSVWTYDETARAYYYHKFYEFQPDLNVSNQEVQEEIRRVLQFWLTFGTAGFRLDATPFMVDNKGAPWASPQDPEAVLEEFLSVIGKLRPDASVLAEMGLNLEELKGYFGRRSRPNLPMNFLSSCYLFLALAQREAAPLALLLRKMPAAPDDGQWANLLRNLDELNLNWLSDAEQQTVFRAFAPEKGMRVFGRGIRRRLAPMLGGDRQRLELAFSLLFAMTGTPLIAYGDEIGIGDDLSLAGRDAVHVAMQWSDSPGAGFSSAPAQSFIRPVVAEGPYAYHHVNVAAQQADPDSLLNFMKRLIATRRQCQEIGDCECEVLETDKPQVLAQAFHRAGSGVYILHNLGDTPCRIELNLDTGDGALTHLLGNAEDAPGEDAPGEGAPGSGGVRQIKLPAYGYQWYRTAHK